jgi:hypothetical protein
MATIPRDLQVTAMYRPPCPDKIFTNVITYALMKLPEGWPSDYWRDTEYVAKVARFVR